MNHQSPKTIWNTRWSKFTKSTDIYPNRLVIKNIQSIFNGNLQNISILEVGAGSGIDSIYLSKMGAKLTTLDFSPKSISISQKLAQKHSIKLNTILADYQKIPFKSNTFDLVFSVGLVEHFKKPLPIIKEQLRVVKKNGYLLIDVPQKYNLYTIVKKIRMLTHTFAFGWETEYSLQDLKKISKIFGVKIVKLYGRDSAFTLKFKSNLKNVWKKFISIIESNQTIAPRVCLNIGVFYKK